jgi:hypothetical protein
MVLCFCAWMCVCFVCLRHVMSQASVDPRQVRSLERYALRHMSRGAARDPIVASSGTCPIDIASLHMTHRHGTCTVACRRFVIEEVAAVANIQACCCTYLRSLISYHDVAYICACGAGYVGRGQRTTRRHCSRRVVSSRRSMSVAATPGSQEFAGSDRHDTPTDKIDTNTPAHDEKTPLPPPPS